MDSKRARQTEGKVIVPFRFAGRRLINIKVYLIVISKLGW
jgi:hypothetical protein